MSELILTLTPEAQERLEALAGKLEKTVDECAQLALSEFLDTWEDHLRVIDAMDDGEERPALKVVND